MERVVFYCLLKNPPPSPPPPPPPKKKKGNILPYKGKKGMLCYLFGEVPQQIVVLGYSPQPKTTKRRSLKLFWRRGGGLGFRV